MTLDFYNKNAKQYFEQTKDINMQFIYDKFEKYLKEDSYILDLGCGSGRDSKYFLQQGYNVEAIDGSVEMCNIASKYINRNVLCMSFDEIKDKNKYDAIWACASLLHVPYINLKLIFKNLFNSLKSNGAFYASFKYGNEEHIVDGKLYDDIDEERVGLILKDLIYIKQYEVFYNYEKRIEGIQKWINIILVKE